MGLSNAERQARWRVKRDAEIKQLRKAASRADSKPPAAPASDAEIERLRTEQVALVDTFSKRVAQALGDAGEVLNPEQRRKLADRLPPPGTIPPLGGPPRFWNR